MGWSTVGSTPDRLGSWALETFEDSYGHAGFVYVPTARGGVVALGGDSAITVGWYASDDDLAEGDCLGYWDTDDDDETFELFRAVVRCLVAGGSVFEPPHSGPVLVWP